MKRIASIVLILILIFAVPVSAKDNILSIGRVSAVMPDITMEIRGTGYDMDDATAYLDSEKLSVESSAVYDKNVNSTCTYILLDLSRSIYDSFDLAKESIIKHIEGMGSKDQLVLIVFGTTEVKTLLDGDESREEAIKLVNSLRCTESGTMFYEALNKAYQLSTSTVKYFDREYVIAFSDGIDEQIGSSTYNEVLALYDSHMLPVYAACAPNAKENQKSVDSFSELARTSGGAFAIIDDEDDFEDLQETINDVTIVKLKASNNHVNGQEKQLSIKIGDSQLECNVPISRSVEDTTAPEVKKIVFNNKKNVFELSFTEKVIGATELSSYKFIDPEGNRADISGVFYDAEADVYEIKLRDKVVSGKYTIEFSGITDTSKEMNPVTKKAVVKVSGMEEEKEGFPVWLIIVIVAIFLVILAVVLLIVISSSKKKEPEIYENSPKADMSTTNVMNYQSQNQHIVKHHIVAESAVNLNIKIKTGKTSEQNISTTITSSMIVGRSDTCDIYIDDTKLSRQHFVIENDNGNLYIMDLQSRNGTMLNGIRINTRQTLHSGDKVFAGLSEFIITVGR